MKPRQRRSSEIRRRPDHPALAARPAVLVLDDFTLLARALQSAIPQVEVVSAATLTEARERWEERDDWRLVFADVHLKADENGVDFLDWVRPLDPDVWLVVFSARITPTVARRARGLRAGYLSKPATLGEIRRWVSALLAVDDAGPVEQLYRLTKETLRSEELTWAIVQLGDDNELTPAEVDVLAAATRTTDRREASVALRISENTWRRHASSIRKKSGRHVQQLALDAFHRAFLDAQVALESWPPMPATPGALLRRAI